MMMVLAESDNRLKKYCEAFQLLKGKNLDQAASKLRELAKEDPEYLNAHRYLGIVFMEKEDFKEAISELSLVVREGEGRPGKFRNDLVNRCDGSIYGEEAKEFEQEKDDNGHLAWAYHDLGMAYLWKDNYVEAERCLLEALKKSDKDLFRNDLGWAYYKWDKLDLAIEQYDRVIKNESKGKSGTGHANFFRGLALFKKGRLSLARKALEEARREFQTQAQAKPPYRIFYELMVASALNNLGRIKMEEGDDREAKRLFQEGLAICEREECQKHIDQLTPREKRKEKKTFAALHNNLGLLYFNKGLLDAAKKEFEAALKLEELPETYNNLAAVSYKEGAKEKAESYLKNALRLDPLLETANANLGRLRGEDTSWWDWWFKPRQSESRLRGLVGGLLVIALILMVANMVGTSFSGGVILPSVNNKTTEVQEDISKNVTKGSSETTETKSTKTTTTEDGPSLESKMLLTALIFFVLVHPRIKVFTLGEAKFEMDTESVSSGSLYSEGAISS